jgi:hypothetical protein
MLENLAGEHKKRAHENPSLGATGMVGGGVLLG